MSTTHADSMDQVIRERRTTKLLSREDLPVVDMDGTVDELLETAGWAPFHRACDSMHRENKPLSGIEPWRFYRLDAATCRHLRSRLPSDISGKIPSMLAAADAMLMVTWLPNPASSSSAAVSSIPSSEQASESFVADYPPRFEPTLANMEHIAAASAAVQNLLIAATARNIATYWSTGGVLRCPAAFDLMHIPREEILLGAIFLFPAATGSAEVVGSKLREHRTLPEHWSRRISLA